MKIKFEPNEFEIGKEYRGKVVEIGGNGFPLPVDGSLLRVDIRVYWMQNGKRRWIETGEIFKKMGEDLGFTQADIRPIEAWQMETIPEGKIISQWPENVWPEPNVDKFILGYLPQSNWRLPEAKALGFGIMHSHKRELDFWREQLDLCQIIGMKAIVQMRDGASMPDKEDIKKPVVLFRNHPALWGWMTVDDFDYRHISRERQRTLYNWIKEFDTEHPVGVTGCHTEWEKYLEPRAFDVLYYLVYAYRDAITDPDAWLNWMCDRLADYNLAGKRIIPVIQSFGPRGDYHTPHIEHSYNLVKNKLGIKSSGCWDWGGIAKHPEFRDEVKRINNDR